MNRRVKITALGPVTPAGIGKENFYAGINEAKSRVSEVTRFDKKGGPFVAAQILDFDLDDWSHGAGNPKRVPRQTQFAIVGCILALADAGIPLEAMRNLDPVIVNGSAFPDPDLTYRTVAGVVTKGPRFAVPAAVVDAGPSAITASLAKMLKTRCRTIAIQSACCAGMDAIGHGAQMIASGQADIAICWERCPRFPPADGRIRDDKALPLRNARSPHEMGRPFDLWRNSGVLGEGACVLILEAEDSPRPAYAWIEGYAYSNDEAGLSGNGLAAAIRMALANARCQPSRVDLINAWGPGHTEIDAVEADCLCKVFGERLGAIPAVSIKGAIGNPLAAAGSVQITSTALSLRTGRVPPTVNWETPDPECPLNLSRIARDVGCSVALVNAHGLGGTNASMVLFRE